MLKQLDRTTWIYQSEITRQENLADPDLRPFADELGARWIRQESGFTGQDGEIGTFFATYSSDPRGDTHADRSDTRMEFDTLEEAIKFFETPYDPESDENYWRMIHRLDMERGVDGTESFIREHTRQ